MKRLLLASDDYIYWSSGKYYAENRDMYNMYYRYLRVFDQLKLVSRVIEEPELKKKRVLIEDERITIVGLPIFHGLAQYLKSYFQVEGMLQGVCDDCDAAILRIPSAVSYNVFHAVKKTKIPYATEVVYSAYDDYKCAQTLKEKLLEFYVDKNMKQMCNSADGVSCVTQYYLQRQYFSKKPGAFKSYYSSAALNDSAYSKPKEFAEKNEYTIAHVALQIMGKNGRKGHKELIDAAMILKRRNIKVRLSFVGGDYNGGIEELKRYAIENSIIDQVDFIGFLNRDELNSYLEKADLFVLPTKAEGLPRVILEAMAKGLPCITTNVSGNSELIQKDLLFDFYDVDTLANKIENLLSHKEFYQDVSKRNFEKSLEYKADVLQLRRDEFYQKLYDVS